MFVWHIERRKSLYINPHRVRHLTIHRQHDIHLAAPKQAARNQRVDLIQAGQAPLRLGE